MTNSVALVIPWDRLCKPCIGLIIRSQSQGPLLNLPYSDNYHSPSDGHSYPQMMTQSSPYIKILNQDQNVTGPLNYVEKEHQHCVIPINQIKHPQVVENISRQEFLERIRNPNNQLPPPGLYTDQDIQFGVMENLPYAADHQQPTGMVVMEKTIRYF